MRKISINQIFRLQFCLKECFLLHSGTGSVSNLTDDKNFKIRTESRKTKLIVIADADIIRNEVRRIRTGRDTSAPGSG